MGISDQYLRLRAQEFFGNYKLLKYLDFLRKSQYFTEEVIFELQSQKLKKLINSVFKNIKFYSVLFNKYNLKPSDIKTPSDLVKLPVMTKEIYRKNFPENISNLNAKKKDLYLNSTSGSSGTPFKFYMSQTLRGHAAARLIRFYEWADQYYGAPFIRIWGVVNTNLKIKLFNKYIENVLLINAFDLSNKNLYKYYQSIVKRNSKLLEAYTSGAFALALLLKENGLSLNIPSTIVSGETLYNFQLDTIKEQFNTEIYNRYGCREFGNIAQECSEHKGLHISQEDFIIEILDNDDKPVKDGERGKIIVTCLDNYSMPFIRYQIDDIGVLSTKKCTCGRNLKMLDSVEGRVSDMINAPSGRHISLYFFALVFQGLSEYINEFQVVQIQKSKELILMIIPTNKYNEKIEQQILNQVRNMDNSFHVSIEKVEIIPLESTGKKKYLKTI